jgi:uncharacterized protein (DUF1015 family)
MKISPFAALRPTPENVSRVASVPYDTIDTNEAKQLAVGNADSFLHVIRPEIDLPEGTDVHADCVYQKAADNLQDFMARGILVRESEPCCYVYRQIMNNHAQIGVVTCCNIGEYERGTILKHEKTRRDKEDDRTRHVLTLKAHTGPVFLTYRDNDTINALVTKTMATEPLFDITANDGVQHTVWRMAHSAALVDAFTQIPEAYIADGHHRSAAALRAGTELRSANPNHNGTEEYNWFLTVLFPASQLQILPYNRVVFDLNGLEPDALMNAVSERFTVTDGAAPTPQEPHTVSMYLAGKWYGLAWEHQPSDDPVAALDVSILQDRLLDPLLGIDDPRTSQRIAFIGGIRGTDELEKWVDSGRGAVAFSVYPVSVEEMMAIADADQIMPPKSTWFEPKLRSGLLVHTL